jgi:hypothetical protein
MEPFERPPLAPLVADEISQSMDEIDRRYWPLIIEFRVARFIPPDIPVPRQRPHQLIEVFKSYAKELYEAEASRYESFRASGMYPTWLSNLNNRIAVHLQKVFHHLEESAPSATLLYHGIVYLRIDADVRELMFALGKQYTQGEARPQIESSKPAPVSLAAFPQEESIGRQIKRLQEECGITAEDMAEALEVVPRSIYKHLAGTTMPRRIHIAAYEKLFSECLKRSVTLRKSVKGR